VNVPAPRGRRLAAAGLVCLAASLGARADAASARPAGPSVFLGYSYVHAGDAGLHGLRLDASRPLRPAWALVVDVAGHWGSFAGADLGQLELRVGARRSWRVWRLRPYADLGLGLARQTAAADGPGGRVSTAHTRFLVGPGAGVDRPLGSRWAVRATFDLLLVRAEGEWDADPRLSAGAVYRFGR
jgi:hypothetical protein